MPYTAFIRQQTKSQWGGGRKVSILDFGGGDGSYYFLARRIIPADIPLQWNVVDTEKMAAAMSGYRTDELFFSSSLQELSSKSTDKIDIVFTSGTIQYTAEPYSVLKDLINIGSRILIFNRQSLSLESFDIVSVQTSLLSWHGYGPAPADFTEQVVQYPHTSIQIKKFEEIVSEKYDVLYTYEETSGIKKVGKYKVAGKSYYCLHR